MSKWLSSLKRFLAKPCQTMTDATNPEPDPRGGIDISPIASMTYTNIVRLLAPSEDGFGERRDKRSRNGEGLRA